MKPVGQHLAAFSSDWSGSSSDRSGDGVEPTLPAFVFALLDLRPTVNSKGGQVSRDGLLSRISKQGVGVFGDIIAQLVGQKDTGVVKDIVDLPRNLFRNLWIDCAERDA